MTHALLQNYSRFRFDRDGRILTVTITGNAVNAVDAAMHDELARLFIELQADPDSDLIVLTGQGRAFCAGGDFDWFDEQIRNPAAFRAIAHDAKRIVSTLLDLEKPILCRMNGAAAGLGATIALLCDVIIADETAKIGDPHVKVGLVAGDGGAVIWPQLIGFARAKELLLTGDLIPATEAVTLGLINYALPADQLDAKVSEIAGKILGNPRWAVRWTKTVANIALKQLAVSTSDAAVAYEMLSNMTADRAEAVNAFRERRKPDLTGGMMAGEPDHIQQLRRVLRRFVAEKAPREKRREWDRTHTFPRDLFAELAGLGLCGLTISEADGGGGTDILAAVVAIEELTRAGSFLAGPFIQCAFYGGMNISENGSAEQKAALLPRLARGELFFAYGLSEPDVGGDLSAVTTRARREGDEIVVSGAKRWCTGADFSDYIYCLVRSDPEAPARRSLSFVLIPTDAPGVSLSPIDHVNLRYTLSSDVFLDEVRLPVSAIVGGPERWNDGWRMLAGRALDIEKLEITACAFGLAQAAVEEAWQYAQERVQFGKPICAHQAVRHKLVEARTKLEACRLMLYHAANLADDGEPCAVETSMAKLFVADTGVEIALICQQVMGAYALSDAYDMERNVRDLLSMPIVGGSSNMQKNNIAALLKLPG